VVGRRRTGETRGWRVMTMEKTQAVYLSVIVKPNDDGYLAQCPEILTAVWFPFHTTGARTSARAR
jgi:hypothetical protein